MDLSQRPTASTSATPVVPFDDAYDAYIDAGPRTEDGVHAYRSFGKRGLDILLVLLATPILLPILVLCALAVMTDGHSPFYVQRRVGRDRRIFRMLKLRSMVIDADARMQAHLAADPAAREEWRVNQKLRDDPRITRVGRFIRKTSIDELPQLFNVLKGDMSLVGPRPMTPEQMDEYPGSAYYTLRPGVTGLWQICDRNEVSFAGRARFDETYAKDITLAEDLRIMLRTPGVMLRGTGL